MHFEIKYQPSIFEKKTEFSTKINTFKCSEQTAKYFLKIKGELQRENKLITYERAFKMLENDIYIAGLGNLQRGISLLQKFLEIFGNMRLISPKMTSHLKSHTFEILKMKIFSKPCKIGTCNLKK